MRVWEDRCWRVLFFLVGLATLIGLENLRQATIDAARVVPIFQAPPPETPPAGPAGPCPCEKPAKVPMEVIEHKQK